MNYNAIISHDDITDESGVFEEPVSIDELKDYLRLEGYVDNDESTSDELSEFDFDDPLIADVLKASRQLIEEKAGITIVPKTIEAVITNLCGMIEIPYGPVISITSLLNCEGEAIESTSYKIIGNKWKYLAYPCYSNMTITYEAGWEVLPTSIKLDIMRLAAYLYENRGDDQGAAKFASQLVRTYSRKTAIV